MFNTDKAQSATFHDCLEMRRRRINYLSETITILSIGRNRLNWAPRFLGNISCCSWEILEISNRACWSNFQIWCKKYSGSQEESAWSAVVPMGESRALGNWESERRRNTQIIWALSRREGRKKRMSLEKTSKLWGYWSNLDQEHQ